MNDKYTLFTSADKMVQEYLDIIVDKIKDSVSGLKAIVLSGGFGRGEGAVDFVGNKPRLINDFDIYLITKKQISDDFLEELGKECSKLIGKGGLEYPESPNLEFDFSTFFNVDLRCIKYSRLKHLPPTVRYFELKRSTKILYGENIYDQIPEIQAEELPVSEGLRLLSNRMVSMSISMKQEYFKKNPKNDEKGILNYYISKAYLSCCESLLLLAGKFAPTYIGRNKTFSKIYEKEFPELHKRFPELAKKVDFATNYKLKPSIGKMNYKKEWFIARNHVLEIFKYVISEITKKQSKDFLHLNKIIQKDLQKY